MVKCDFCTPYDPINRECLKKQGGLKEYFCKKAINHLIEAIKVIRGKESSASNESI